MPESLEKQTSSAEKKRTLGAGLQALIFMVRHLLTTDNAKLLYGSGDSDAELLPDQEVDPNVIAELKSELRPGYIIVHTGLKRTVRTAEMLAQALEYTGDLLELPEFQERYAGVFAGRRMEELYDAFPDAFGANPTPNEHWLVEDEAQGPEPLQTFLRRLQVGKAKLAELANGRDALVVAHAGTVKGFSALEVDPDQQLPQMVAPTPANGSLFIYSF